MSEFISDSLSTELEQDFKELAAVAVSFYLYVMIKNMLYDALGNSND